MMVMRQLITQAPMLIVYTVGIVMAFVYWRRYPRPCLFTLIAASVMLLVALVFPLTHIILFQALSRFGWTASMFGSVLTAVGIVGNLIHAAAFGLLIAAVFADRAVSQQA